MPEERALSVSEITGMIRQQLEPQFRRVLVCGEVSNYKPASSGHAYFKLKDENAIISAVFFKSSLRRLPFAIENGTIIIVRGRVSVYGKGGTYQIVCDHAEPEGKGGLQLAFEQLKRKLLAEGLFAPSRKKPLPSYPNTIGVITSPTGAAIRDILSVLTRRFPGLRIIVFPTAVQGEEAKYGVCEGVRALNHIGGVDLIITGRGGGSLEDLWAFNEEMVARAIAQSRIPVVSAVGHEVDYTIADFTADVRAPTPSAAAELVVPNKTEIQARVQSFRTSMLTSLTNRLQILRGWLERFSDRRFRQYLENALYQKRTYYDDYQQRLYRHAAEAVTRERQRFMALREKLNLLDPKSAIRRGYAMVFTEKETLLKDAGEVSAGDTLRVELKRGQVRCSVLDIAVDNPPNFKNIEGADE